MYLEFQNTFDEIPHNNLMLKIKELENAGNVHNWIEN